MRDPNAWALAVLKGVNFLLGLFVVLRYNN
jgi:hypothetical protein